MQNYWSNKTASHSWRPESLAMPLWEPKMPNKNFSMPSAKECIAKWQRAQLHIMVSHHRNGKHLCSNNTHVKMTMLKASRWTWLMSQERGQWWTWSSPPITFTSSICSPIITPPVNMQCSRKILRLLYIYVHLYLFNSSLKTTCKEHSFKLQKF